MARDYYNLVLKAEPNKKTRDAIEENQKAMLNLVTELLQASTINDEEENSEQPETQAGNSECVPTVLDPERATTKGRNKRKKGAIEKAKSKNKKKNSKDATSRQRKEFGAKTPNLRLF